MRLLLDTHFVLWLIHSPGKLSPRERTLLGNGEAQCIVSVISIWELRLKWDRRRERGREALVDPAKAIALVRAQGMELAPLTPEQCIRSLEVPITHRDPFDEQLLLHAQALGANLLTRDRALRDHPLVYRFA